MTPKERKEKLRQIEAEAKREALIKKLAAEPDENNAEGSDPVFDQLVDALFDELPD
jgi:hypothetical protein